MEIEEKITKKCFKLSQTVYENLYVTYYRPTSVTVLWNKYQIFIYDEFRFEECTKVILPEFDIFQLAVTNNNLICLDFSGNVHLIPLKFKHSATKIFKSTFQPREKNIISIESTSDYIYSLKFASKTNFICQHKINPDFITEAEIEINSYLTYEPCFEKSIFHVYNLCESEFQDIHTFFEMNTTWKQHVLILLCFDKLTAYAILYCGNLSSGPLKLKKLYTSTANICDFTFLRSDLSVLISLTIGTIIKIPLTISKKEVLVHLNSALSKLIAPDNYILYTDGINLWKTEKAFSNDITFNNFFVKNVKDFCSTGEQIICTTYNNLVYLFDNDEALYMKSTTQEFIPADTVLSNSDCLKKIMEETAKSEKIVNKINRTKNYITALALSARQDVMNDIINYNIIVYEDFNAILKEKLVISLVDDIKSYCDVHLTYFLIKISTTSLQQKFSEILSNVFGDLKIHIIVKSMTDILKIVTITIDGQLKKTNIVIPLNYSLVTNSNRIHINIRLISKISGVLYDSEPLWVILHDKHVIINSEHFIKTYKTDSNIFALNNKTVPTDKLLYENAVHLYGHLLQFNKILNTNTKPWYLYVKLLENYEESLKNYDYLKEYFNHQRADAIFKQISDNDFLKARTEICFDIGNKVKLKIIKDVFSKPLLEISSQNLELAFNIKLFFANLVYCYKKLDSEMEFVDQAVYSSMENLEQEMKKVINYNNEQEILNLFEQYQKILSSLLI